MFRKHYATVMSTIAAVLALAALTMGGAIAAGKITITSKDIKNNTIKTQDLAKNAVQAPDIKNGAVRSADIANSTIDTADIGAGEVTPQDVSMPEPVQIKVPPTEENKVVVTNVSQQYSHIATVGHYNKISSDSALEVTWTGAATTSSFTCNFELRVDGQSSGGGEVFAAGNGNPISTTALFKDLSAGSKAIEVWVKRAPTTESGGSCVLGPVEPNIAQTYVVSEKVL